MVKQFKHLFQGRNFVILTGHSVNLTSDKQDAISVVANAVSLVLVLDRKTGTQTISTPQPILHVIVIRPSLSERKNITHRMCICSKHC